MVAKVGQCNGKQYYFFDMRYKTAKGRQWKKYARFFWLSDAIIKELVTAPVQRVLELLIAPPATTVDYFRLIKYEGEEIWQL